MNTSNRKKSRTQRTQSKKRAQRKNKGGDSIGTRNESSLHRALKFQYAGSGGLVEAEIGDFVADGVRSNGELVEIQTGSFGPLKKKVKSLAKNGKVRIIHPIAVTKIIEVYSSPPLPVPCSLFPLPSSPPPPSLLIANSSASKSKLLYRRKSPVHGTIWNLFDALLYAPELPLMKGVTIEVVLVDITEKRVKDGKGSRRRKGVSKVDKELTAFHDSIILTKKSDYYRFIPFKNGEEFTVTSHAEKAGVKRHISQKALYVLTKMKIVERIGKKGNSWVYIRSY